MDELRSRLAHGVAWVTIVIGGLSLSDWGIVIGIVTSLGTFAVNWYYARQKARRGLQG